MTKRMVRGGEATSERRRRDGVYQKSSKRAFTPVSATPTNALRALVNSPLFENSSRVHELVARTMRGEHVRQGINRKSAVLPFPTISAIPRERTKCTKKPSRFVHALSARPLKVQGGRGSDTYADETIKITLISLCSHTDAHPNLNREVRHSLTWHSSESESALERFEPVAAAKL